MQGEIEINAKPYWLETDDSGTRFYRDYYEGKAGNSKVPIEMAMAAAGGGQGFGVSGYGYGDSKGFDCREQGKIKLFPKENSASLENKGVVVTNGADNPNSTEVAGPNDARNWSFNEWDNSSTLTGSYWVKSTNLVIEKEESTTHQGPAALKFTGGDSDVETLTNTINLRTFTNTGANQYALQCRRVVFSAWVYCDAVDSIRLKLQTFTAPGMFVGKGNLTASAWEQIKVVAYLMWPYNTNLGCIIEWNRLDSFTTATATATSTFEPGEDIVDDCSVVFESDSSGTPEDFYLDGDNLYLFQGSNVYQYSDGAPFNFLTKVPSIGLPIEVSDDSGDSVNITDEAQGKYVNDVPICRGKMSILSDKPFYGVMFKVRSDYTVGNATFPVGSRTITGTATVWDSDMVGCWINETTNDQWYRIGSVETATSLTIEASTGHAVSDGVVVGGDGAYTITPRYTSGDYSGLSVQYNNGGWTNVPWLSDQTDSFGSYIHASSTIYDDRYYIICWDTANMDDWETTTPSYASGGKGEGYEIRIDCSVTPVSSYWTYANQIFLLSTEDDEGVITEYGSGSIGSAIYDIVPYNEKIWTFCGYDYAYCSIDSDGHCFPTYSSADNYGKFCAEHKGKFYTSLADDAISVATNLEIGDFDTPSEVKTGTENLAITSLAIHQNRIIVGKENAIYGIIVWAEGSRDYVASLELGNSGYDSEELTNFGGMPSLDNFRNMLSVDGVLYMPHTKGMWLIDGSDIVNVSPYLRMPEYTDLHGSVQAVCAGRDWNYMVVENDSGSGNSRILAIRKQYIKGDGVDYRIHPLADCSIEDVGSVIFYNDTLWVAGDNASDTPYVSYYIFDDATEYPDFGGSGITVYYRVDGGSWTEVGGSGNGTLTSAGRVPFDTSTADPPSGYTMQVAICDEESDAGPGSASFVWKSGWADGGRPSEKKVFSDVVVTGTGFDSNGGTTDINITGVLINACIDSSDNPQRMWSMKIKCSNNLGSDKRTAAAVRADIKSAFTGSPTTTFVDVHGDTYTVMFEPPTPEEQFVQILTNAPNRNVTNTMNIVFREV